MSKLFLGAMMLSAAVGSSAVVMAAEGAPQKSAEPFKLIHVKDLTAMMADHKTPTYIFDANNEKVRREDGIIHGAKLLPSSKGYDVASTLPADKKAALVFYCANEACMASHAAAEKAASAGYSHVNVLADGIKGWKSQGQKTDTFKKSGT